jgi:RNA polymerase sigma factor (sigma-70 family)
VQLSDFDINQILSRSTGLLQSLARRYPGYPEDDLVQEALIAVWKELKKFNTDNEISVDTIVRNRAAWKMADIVTKDSPWTTGSKKMSRYNKKYSVVSVSPENMEHVSIPGSIALSDIEYSIYRKDIERAISTLTDRQREYLSMKYLQGCSISDLKTAFGYDPHNLMSNKVRVKLRENLRHLESMVS